MVDGLSELVLFVGEEPELTARVRQAVEWVASKPEGLAILQQAKQLHGKPITIITSSKVSFTGYGDHSNNNVIFANPLVNDHTYLHSQNGEPINNSLERFFAHEFMHATQPDVLNHAKQYIAKRSEVFERCTPAIPYEQYQHRFKAIKDDDDAAKALFGEIYDKHIGSKAVETTYAAIRILSEDPFVQAFSAKYEVPAIEFENLMMSKYKGESGRILDYINSGIYEELIKSTDRVSFIESALTSFREHVPKSADTRIERGSESTKPKPREGGWAEEP